MLAQIIEHLSILGQAVIQPGEIVGLETAVCTEISGFRHVIRVSGCRDRNPKHDSRNTSRFQVARL
jgi:hypothetical protein